MAGLVKSTGKSNLSTRTPGDLSTPNGGSQVKGGAYTGATIVEWDAMEPLSRLGASTPDDETDVLSPITIRKDGLHFQKRRAWKATKDSVRIVTLLRPLKAIDGNKMKPSGDWFTSEDMLYTAKNTPSVRQGTIQNSYAAASGGKDSATASMTNPHAINAEESLAMLPDEVQAPLRSLRAKHKDAVFLGSNSGLVTAKGFIQRETVKLVLVAGEQAIVIHAHREHNTSIMGTPDQARDHLNTLPWNVRQITYTLGTPQEKLSGGMKKGIQK